MAFTVRHIATRFALLLAGAAVVPLIGFGAVSLLSLRGGTQQSVVAGNLNVAERAADEIRRYVASHAEILKALAATIQQAGLNPQQQEQILRDYVLRFREFREITLFAADDSVDATSRVGGPRVAVPDNPAVVLNDVAMSAIRLDDEGLPTAVFSVALRRLNQPSGWLVGEFRLEEMWRMVDQIRLGEHGFAQVIATDGALVAHGDPDRKALIAQGLNMTAHPLVGPGHEGGESIEYTDANGLTQLAVSARIPDLNWAVVVEQPTSEAYARAIELQQQLAVAITVALLVMVGTGLWFGRRYFIAPIFALQRATQSIAGGHLDTRVDIRTGDEFAALGGAFNTMADRLVELQENVKRQERQAMFGRIAAGLVHDLSHPIMNIGNSTSLLARDDMDEESRASFHKTIERELNTLKRFMDDLRNVVKPRPIERVALDVNRSLADVVDPLRAEGDRAGITLEARYAPEPLTIDGDGFALGRVYRNLISNAIQATAAGGRVSVTTRSVGPDVEVTVADTGSGIPPDRLSSIFDDFVTTKRRGLGLGLAISKGIVEQLGGTISVESEVGRGTTFTLRFPSRA